MKILALYRFIRQDGGVTVSPIQPKGEYDIVYQVAADEGKALWRGDKHLYSIADLNNIDEWVEVEKDADTKKLIKEKNKKKDTIQPELEEEKYTPSQDIQKKINKLTKENKELKAQLDKHKLKAEEMEKNLITLSLNIKAEEAKNKIKKKLAE